MTPGSRVDALSKRVYVAIQWRLRNLKQQINGWLARRGASWFIAAHWPWPMKKPFQRSRLKVLSFGGGIGDELMCMPILAEIKRRNPQCHITYSSRFPEFFRNNPAIDEIERQGSQSDADFVVLSYQHAIPPPRPLITLMAECVGLQMTVGRLEPPQIGVDETIRQSIDGLDRPRVVIQPLSSRWTPNKLWPQPNWVELVALLVKDFDVIEAGTETAFPGNDFGPHFTSFAGKTDLNGFAYLISRATVFVGPVSGGMHLANAFKIPSVIIFGGYESPTGYNYPGLEALYEPVECAPCWLTNNCPYDLKCMKAIRPKDVLAAISHSLAK